MATYDFKGSSGISYTYSIVREDMFNLPNRAGHYILATGTDTDPCPIFVESATNIKASITAMIATDAWRIAKEIYGATLLYVRPDGHRDEQSRSYEKLDLLDRYRPVMNVHDAANDT